MRTSVIKKPYISEKATFLSEGGKYVFLVDPKAKSAQIKNEIENIYKVNVRRVNIIRKTQNGSVEKKAVVTLKEGEKIDIIPH